MFKYVKFLTVSAFILAGAAQAQTNTPAPQSGPKTMLDQMSTAAPKYDNAQKEDNQTLVSNTKIVGTCSAALEGKDVACSSAYFKEQWVHSDKNVTVRVYFGAAGMRYRTEAKLTTGDDTAKVQHYEFTHVDYIP